MPELDCLRILVLIAAPVWDEATGREPVHLDMRQEWRKIADGIQGKPSPVRLERLPLPTERALDDALAQAARESPYAVVHISGHGAQGRLALDDGYGRVHRVDARTLGETFHRRGVQLVVLNTCHSAEAAPGDLSVADALVAAGVQAVVGMGRPISDASAIRLAEVLYQRLASGYPVARAVEQVRQAIRHDPQLRGLDADVPVVRGEGDLTLRLGPGEPGLFPHHPPNNLPHNPYFFGRADQLVRIAQVLADTRTRAVAIAGLGGIGKSALAVEAAWRNAPHFRAVVWTEASEGLGLGLERVQDEARRILGLDPTADLLAALNARPCLLVLDNLHWLPEGEWPPIADFLRRLDPACSKALFTYRVPWPELGDLAGLAELSLPDLDPANAVALLRAEGRAKGVDWLTWGRSEGLAELARLCRHHPYFLRLGAARAARQPLKQLVADLDGLHGEFQDWAGRFLDGQVAALGENGRVLFPRLSAFAGSADREAVAAIGGEGVEVDAALLELTMAALVDYLPDEGRYRLHDLAQAYARRRLSVEEALEWGRRHAAYFLEQAEGAVRLMGTDRALEGMEQAKAERENWLAGQAWYEEHGDWDGVIAYGYALDDLLDYSGYWGDRRAALARAVEAAERRGDRGNWSRLAHNLGVAYQAQGDYQAARGYYEESLKMTEALGDRAGVSKSLHNLGALAQDQGDYQAARGYYEESLKIKEALGDRAGVAISTGQLGRLAELEGDYVAAVRAWAAALTVFEELRSPNADIIRDWFQRLRERLGEKQFRQVMADAGLESV